jgi:hypothetical protein
MTIPEFCADGCHVSRQDGEDVLSGSDELRLLADHGEVEEVGTIDEEGHVKGMEGAERIGLAYHRGVPRSYPGQHLPLQECYLLWAVAAFGHQGGIGASRWIDILGCGYEIEAGVGDADEFRGEEALGVNDLLELPPPCTSFAFIDDVGELHLPKPEGKEEPLDAFHVMEIVLLTLDD